MSGDQPQIIQVVPEESNQIQTLLNENLTNDTSNTSNTSNTRLAAMQNRAQALIDEQKEVLRREFNADSHELAYQTPKDRGAAQTGGHEEVVRDIGWHKADNQIPDPLIAGYSNGELFAYIRRFNKVRVLRAMLNRHS